MSARSALAALVLSGLGAACGGRAAPPGAAPGPDLGYAGAAACVRCHADEGRRWSASPHGRHGSFAATPEGGADLAVGSRWMQAYLRRGPGGLHAIVPTCLDLRDRTWRPVPDVLLEISGARRPEFAALAPPDPPPLATRAFETDCAGCHASQPRLDVRDGAVVPRRTDPSINCEACHGPGRAHAASWTRLEPPVAMPRLGRLEPRTATAVCARCHGGPPTVGDYGPADAAHYVADLQDHGGTFADGRAAGQVYQAAAFARSPCATAGGLTCTGCHDAHGPDLATTTGLDGLCVRCHAGHDERRHTHHAPQGTGARCVACHMPRLLDGLVAHQRDHRIGVPLPQVRSGPDACTACHRDHDKAWASTAWQAWWGAPPAATIEAVGALDAARAGRIDREALARAATHPDPWLRANAALHLGDASALRTDPRPEVRLVAVAAALKAGAAPGDLEALADDREPRVRGAALVALAQLGRAPRQSDAPALERAARQQRGAPALRVLLADLYARAGDRPEAARWALEGWLVDPRDARGAEQAAGAALRAGDPGSARAVLETAARVVPEGPGRQRVADLLRRLDGTSPRGGRP